MKAPPPPAEIFKRRGVSISSIITKCFDETIRSNNLPHVTEEHKSLSPSTSSIEDHEKSDSRYDESSRWNNDTDRRSSSESEIGFDYEESREKKLNRYRLFFDNGPLMRCLDSADEERQIADRLFERLLREVQQPSLADIRSTRRSRGEVQVRAFWDNVRRQLQTAENSLQDDSFPSPPSGTHTHLNNQFGRTIRFTDDSNSTKKLAKYWI